MSDLHDMFKQMSEVVYEQGQIVDRIDYNIEKALDQVDKGTKELEQVIDL